MNSHLQRPKDWLNDFDTTRIESLADGVMRLWRTGTDPRTYTPHDPGHFQRVEGNLRRLLPRDEWHMLSEQERFLLTCCAWTHDIAMHPAAYGDEGDKLSPSDIRRLHVHTSAEWVIKHRKEYGLSHNEAVLVAEINRHHSRSHDIGKCSAERICGGEMVRPQLLASYLRLADALEVAHARVEESEVSRFLFLQEVIADTADFTLFHWIKSFVVAGIAVLPAQHTFRVEFQIPEDDLEQVLGKDVLSSIADSGMISSIQHSKAERSSRYRLLTQYALDELRNELESVEDILAAQGPTSFHIVEALETVRILRGAAKPTWSIGLRRVVNYLNVAYSPNSSGTASAALNAIDDAVGVMCDRSNVPKDKLHEPTVVPTPRAGVRAIPDDAVRISRDAVVEVIPHLRTSLQARLKQRKCHNELRRITSFVVSYAKALIDFDGDEHIEWLRVLDDFRKTLSDMLAPDGDRMKYLRAEFLNAIKLRHAQAVKDKSKVTILLFGNSATVADALATIVNDVEFGGVHCYIAEGRGKSKHGPHNKPVYLDAETYAATIHSSLDRIIVPSIKGRQRDERLTIQVIPDAAVGRVLDRNHADERHPQAELVLFGANGIFREPDIRVAHTCGHLSIAATAKHFDVPVYVVSSAVKIAERPNSKWRKAQRSPNEWIAGKASDVVGRLKAVGASAAWNPSEEQVGLELVDLIITDLGSCDCKKPEADVKVLLQQWEAEITKQLEPKKSFEELLAEAR